MPRELGKTHEGLERSKIGEWFSGPFETGTTRMGIAYPTGGTVPLQPLSVQAAEELGQARPLRLPLTLPMMMRIVAEDRAREEAPADRLQVLVIQEEAEEGLEEEGLAAMAALQEEEVVEVVQVVPVDPVAASIR